MGSDYLFSLNDMRKSIVFGFLKANYNLARGDVPVTGKAGLLTINILTEYRTRPRMRGGRKPNSSRPLPYSIACCIGCFYNIYGEKLIPPRSPRCAPARAGGK